ncbi:MAG TPA: M13 family metallopeptidase [Steroidobacteraceae bacterium]|nr:M13 family metallopeptidase [Steroidobacteraceae bacterium]
MTRRIPLLALCLTCGALASFALLPAGKAADAPDTAPTARQAAIGDFGVDLSARKLSVKPGDDFFSFANGQWYDTFTIPEDRTSYGSFVILDEVTRKRVRGIIEEAAAKKSAPGTPEQKIGDFYATFMDLDAIEAAGIKPVQPDLDRIRNARTPADIAALFGSPGFDSTFTIQFIPDLKNPNVYSVTINQGGLGMPDRDYYIKDDPRLKEFRAKYVAYLEQMLTLVNDADAGKHAQAAMAFETAVAQAQWPIEKQRDVEANYNPRSKKELLEQVPGFEWQAFLEPGRLGKRDTFVLSEIDAIKDIAKLVGDTDPDTLKAYLTVHYLTDHARYLPARFDDTVFGFYGQTLRGQPKKRERWKRGVDQVNDSLGEQVAQVYVQRYFTPESKAKMQALVNNLLAALRVRIEALDWMTPDTKKRAQDKLGTFITKIGYPDKWKDYSTLEVKRGDLVGNVQRAQVWAWDYQVDRLDKPVDRTEWGMLPQEVNAYYNPLNNEIVFPAAILQPPFFDPNADPAVNYGAIGAGIGHEIGHGFDDQGRKFGPDGSLTDWWSAKDDAAFTARAKKLIQQYSDFEALPGLNVKGENTIGENIGDLGGLNIAYEAYQISLHGQKDKVLDGLSGDQRFFLGWAQVWREKYRDDALRELVLADVHSPPKFRVNGSVRNMDVWYRAFGVKPGDKLYLKPEDRVRIW